MVNSFHSTPSEPETTGRYLVLFRDDAIESGLQMLGQATSRGLSGSEQPASEESVVLPTLGVAIVDAEPAQLRSLAISEDHNPILAIEPEQVVYAIEESISSRFLDLIPPATKLETTPLPQLSIDYLKGYRDAINHLVDPLLSAEQTQSIEAAANETETTWGLQATKVLNSCASGRGIKVAVLDTGLDLTHADFMGRTIVSKSFIAGEEVQDRNGHGTHCVGTACGGRQPVQLPRYGVAHGADIYVGKVLSNRGSGSDGGILQGIEWAIANGCQIISMSLGAPTRVGMPYSPIYEEVAKRALRQGTLIVAAAGNESNRPTTINPVGRPANCPSIMAVGALDSKMQIAWFSTSGLNPDGGQVDIAAPGVAVHSSWPMPTQYRSINGTSMATPHVAGIAALYAEQTGARGQELWNMLIRTARRLPLSSADVGAGIVQAPH
jgi:subtilisin family serine protease